MLAQIKLHLNDLSLMLVFRLAELAIWLEKFAVFVWDFALLKLVEDVCVEAGLVENELHVGKVLAEILGELVFFQVKLDSDLVELIHDAAEVLHVACYSFLLFEVVPVLALLRALRWLAKPVTWLYNIATADLNVIFFLVTKGVVLNLIILLVALINNDMMSTVLSERVFYMELTASAKLLSIPSP